MANLPSENNSSKDVVVELEHGTRLSHEKGVPVDPVEPGVHNKLTVPFFMTMVGFSLVFICAEVIPLFLITLFTVIAFDLNAGSKVIWLLVSQIIAIGAIIPFVGAVTDLLGRKGITLVSLVLTVVSMILIGLTPNIGGMIAGQVLSGIAIGVQLLTSIAAVTELVPVSKRGITIGYVACGFFPFAAASVYGQFLAEISWRWVTLIIGILAATAFVILLIWYKPPPRVNANGLSKRELIGRMDFVGGFLSIAGVTVFLTGLNWGGQDYPWSSAPVISTLTIGIFLMIVFFVWEKYGTKYPMFQMELARHPRLFISVIVLCLTSGINYIPVVVFWVVQTYTVYYADFRQAGIWLLPIGFCIAGGAIISAILLTVFPKRIQWILMFFCILQTAGLGAMAAVDPENINTVWAPLIFGLIGVGGVLLPSQVIFSIIIPHELIGSGVALSLVVRMIGQVIGISMFYNIFVNRLERAAYADLDTIIIPAVQAGFTNEYAVRDLIHTLTAGPFSRYTYLYPQITTQAQIDSIVLGGHNLYKQGFPLIYQASIAFGGVAIISCCFLYGVAKHITDHVAVLL